jgi:CubicO group peptidase (beta-lactamase class C family)
MIERRQSAIEQRQWSRRKVALGIAATASSAIGLSLLGAEVSPPAELGDRTEACRVPSARGDSLQTLEPAETGFDADALCRAMQSVEYEGANIHSVLVMRKGSLVAELYRSGADRSINSLWSSRVKFDRNHPHDMRSISKSVVGLLYGILLERGHVPGIETSVVSLYPEFPEVRDAARRAIRIRHLLTMTAGLEWTEPSPVRRASSTDESGLFYRRLAYPYVFKRRTIARAGERFTYSGGATAVLAEIMVRETGRKLRDIVGAELFEPLGIADWKWVGNLHGTPAAAAGLRMRPRDLLKIGAMMLNRGKWRGRQIVPAEWIMQSTLPHVTTEPVGGYGFQWWSTFTGQHDQRLQVIAAIGNGGQRLFIVPDIDLAVVMTAGEYGDPAIGVPLNNILERVVAAVPR